MDERKTSLAHVARIDLQAPGVSLVATDRGGAPYYMLELPSRYLVRTGAKLAVNANLFTNCCTDAAGRKPGWDVSALRGWQVSGGRTGSPIQNNPVKDRKPFPFSASLIVLKDGSVQIENVLATQSLHLDAETVVTGSHMIVEAGQPLPFSDDTGDFFGLHARTLAGLSADRHVLYLMAVDGATPSAGITLEQAAELMVHVHAATALNLDGGGSTAMVIAKPGGGFRMVSRPSDGVSASCTDPQPSGCERYVGASLGVLASWPAAGK